MCHFRSAICLRGVLVLVLISVASSLSAVANRVFVSARSGNDANACDNINTPCQTFAGAVVQLNPGGEAIVLDSGGYGPVTITKALTIEAPPGVTAFIHPPSGSAVTISVSPTDTVVLRGLVLNRGTVWGILADTVGTLHIENCVISGFVDGIHIQAPDSNIFIKDTISRENSNYGIHFLTGRGSIDHCRVEGNTFGGVEVKAADVAIRDSVSAGNGGAGFRAEAGGSENTVLSVYQCMATHNAGPGMSAYNSGTGSTTVRVANSSISDNTGVGLFNDATGGGFVNFYSLGNSLVRGNFFETLGTITIIAPN